MRDFECLGQAAVKYFERLGGILRDVDTADMLQMCVCMCAALLFESILCPSFEVKVKHFSLVPWGIARSHLVMNMMIIMMKTAPAQKKKKQHQNSFQRGASPQQTNGKKRLAFLTKYTFFYDQFYIGVCDVKEVAHTKSKMERI